MEKNKSLAEFFGTDKVDFKLIDPSQYVHMIIDVQRVYSKKRRNSFGRGNWHTDYVAGKIAKEKPLIENFGIRSMIVFQDGMHRGHLLAGDGLYKIKYNPNKNLLAPKQATHTFSGFKQNSIRGQLQSLRVKNIIISGFNAGACVKAIVEDALSEQFNALLLNDCIGQDTYDDSLNARESRNKSLQEMRDLGAYSATSKELRNFLSETTQQLS